MRANRPDRAVRSEQRRTAEACACGEASYTGTPTSPNVRAPCVPSSTRVAVHVLSQALWPCDEWHVQVNFDEVTKQPGREVQPEVAAPDLTSRLEPGVLLLIQRGVHHPAELDVECDRAGHVSDGQALRTLTPPLKESWCGNLEFDPHRILVGHAPGQVGQAVIALQFGNEVHVSAGRLLSVPGPARVSVPW